MAMHQYSSEHDPSEGSLLWPRSRMALFAQGTFAVLIILLTVALVDIARNDTYDESVVGADLALANQKIQGLPPVEPERVQVHGTCTLHAALILHACLALHRIVACRRPRCVGGIPTAQHAQTNSVD